MSCERWRWNGKAANFVTLFPCAAPQKLKQLNRCEIALQGGRQERGKDLNHSTPKAPVQTATKLPPHWAECELLKNNVWKDTKSYVHALFAVSFVWLEGTVQAKEALTFLAAVSFHSTVAKNGVGLTAYLPCSYPEQDRRMGLYWWIKSLSTYSACTGNISRASVKTNSLHKLLQFCNNVNWHMVKWIQWTLMSLNFPEALDKVLHPILHRNSYPNV